MDHGVKVASVLANSFSRRCSYIAESDAHVKEKAIQFGFVLGKWHEIGLGIHSNRFTVECNIDGGGNNRLTTAWSGRFTIVGSLPFI